MTLTSDLNSLLCSLNCGWVPKWIGPLLAGTWTFDSRKWHNKRFCRLSKAKGTNKMWSKYAHKQCEKQETLGRDTTRKPDPETDEFSLHPHKLFLTTILKLCSHMCLDITSVLFPSGFLISIFCEYLTYVLHAPAMSPSLIWSSQYYLVRNTDYEAPQVGLWNFLELYVLSCLSRLLVPNILLSTLFSNTPSLCFSLIVTDQVPHAYKTRGRTKLTYSLAVWTSKNLGFLCDTRPFFSVIRILTPSLYFKL
jgi:hypothetical protein